MEVSIQEVVPKYMGRSEMGRIVINPPNVSGSLKYREEGRFFMCCNRAFLTEESYKQHQLKVTEHGKPLDFSKLPRPPPPLKPERKDPSSRGFWVQRKLGVVDKVFQANDGNSDLGINGYHTEPLKKSSVLGSIKGNNQVGFKTCVICSLSTQNLSRHMRICHADTSHRCQYCPCTFVSDNSRSRHERLAHRRKALPVVSRKENIVARAKKQLGSTKLARDILQCKLQWKNSRVAQCSICKKVFSAMHMVLDHLNTHYGIKPYKCDLCTMAFNYSSSLRRHKRAIHSSVARHFCSICNAGFPSFQALRSHFKSVHKIDNEVEDGNIFVNLNKEVRSQEIWEDKILPRLKLPTQNANGMYECPICSKQLMASDTWRGHMRIHQNIKPYKCKLCGNNFRLNSTRSSHLKTCHTNGPYKCPHCPCTFDIPRARERHVRSCRYSARFAKTGISKRNVKMVPRYTGKLKDNFDTTMPSLTAADAPGFRCDLCGVIVKLQTDFNKHKLLHSNAERSTCSLCLKTFSRPYDIPIHKERAHGSGAYKCTFCCCRYSASQSLIRHLTRDHGMQQGEWDSQKKCPIPQAVRRIQLAFYDDDDSGKVKDSSDKIMPSLTAAVAPGFKCDLCGVTLNLQVDFKKHKLLHAKAIRLTCSLCLKKFTRTRNVVMHKQRAHGSGAYKCSMCCCRYSTTRAIIRHMTLDHGTHRDEWDFEKECNKPEARRRIQFPLYGSDNSRKVKDNSGTAMPSLTAVDVAGFRCDLCGVILKLETEFNKHKLSHMGADRFTCDLCMKRFCGSRDVVKHKMRAHGKGIFKCTFCCCRYTTTRAIVRHLTIDHGMLRDEWNFQKKRIKPEAIRRIQLTCCESDMEDVQISSEELSREGLITSKTTDKRMIECNLCHFKITLRSLAAHKKKAHFHAGKFKCADCPCKFMVPHGLSVHRAMYHGFMGKEKRRQVKYNLKHRKVSLAAVISRTPVATTDEEQSNTLSYMCTFCEETFPDKDSFGKHVLIHQPGKTTGKQFECDICHAKFTHKSSISHHKQKSHFHNGTFQCSKCPCKFLTSGGLINHKKVHHGYVGLWGGRPRKNRKLIPKRRIIGTGTTLKKMSLLKQKQMKLQNSDNSQFKCSLCAKTLSSQYSLELHLITHTRKGEKNYECELCHLKFLHPNSVVSHKKRCHTHNGKYKCSKCPCKFLALSGRIMHESKFHGYFGREKRRWMKQTTAAADLTGTDGNVEFQPSVENYPRIANAVKGKYQCDLCHLRFLNPMSTVHHKKRCHDHNGKYKCSKCSCKFLKMSGLIIHESKFHGYFGKKKLRWLKQAGSAELNSIEPTVQLSDEDPPNGDEVAGREPGESVECKLCLLQIHANTRMQQHIQNCHLHDGTFQCSFCTCKFKTFNGLCRHKVKYHDGMTVAAKLKLERKNVPTVNDSILKRLLNSREKRTSIFNKAQKVLKKTRQYGASGATCASCGCNFSSRRVLAKHMRAAHTNGAFKCKYCTSSFHNIGGLSRHVNWHETGDTTGKGRFNKISQNERLEDAIETPNNEVLNTSMQATGKFNVNYLKIRGSSHFGRKHSLSKVTNTPTPSSVSLELQQEQRNSTEMVPVSLPRLPLSPSRKLIYKWKCDQCGIRFSAKQYVERHTKNAHVVGGISCNECPCTFATAIVLSAHKRVYHDLLRNGGFRVRKPKSASSSTPAGPSVEYDEDERQGKINASGMVDGDCDNFNPQGTLENNSVETKESLGFSSIRRTKSTDNGQSAKSSASYKKPKLQLRCTWCSKTFASAKLLGAHMLCHTRPERCPKCNLGFRKKLEVLSHIKTHHGNGKFKCQSCSCRFSTVVGRNIHFGSIHKKNTSSVTTKQSLNNGNFVIENEMQEDDDDDDQSFIQVNSTYSRASGESSEFGEESEPIIQGILDGKYPSDFMNGGNSYGQNSDNEEGTNSQDKTTDEDELDESRPDQNCQTSVFPPSVAHSAPTPTKAKAFSPKSRPIKCAACGITCYGPETMRLHLESHKQAKVDKLIAPANSGERKKVAVNEGQDLKCSSCGNQFLNLDELAEHSVMEHDETGHYRCAYCPCTMKTENNLRYHFMKYHDISI